MNFLISSKAKVIKLIRLKNHEVCPAKSCVYFSSSSDKYKNDKYFKEYPFRVPRNNNFNPQTSEKDNNNSSNEQSNLNFKLGISMEWVASSKLIHLDKKARNMIILNILLKNALKHYRLLTFTKWRFIKEGDNIKLIIIFNNKNKLMVINEMPDEDKLFNRYLFFNLIFILVGFIGIIVVRHLLYKWGIL